jgi:outer membrane protein assembly factor BamB
MMHITRVVLGALLKSGLAIVAAAACVPGATGAQDWPHYLGPGYDLDTGLKELSATSVAEVWKAQVKTAMSSLTVADGLVYTMGNDGSKTDKAKGRDIVYCLDANSGKEKWTFAYAAPLDPRLYPGGPNATPTIHAGKVYTLGKFGAIHCLDAKTGKPVWTSSCTHYKPKARWWGFAGSPTVVGDIVVFNAGDRGLGLNKDTGEVVWKSEGSVVGYASPKPLPAGMFKRPALALLTNRKFLVLDPATGRSLATYARAWQEESNCNAVTPYIHSGRFYIVHSAHGMARLSLKGDTFTEDWLSEAGKYPNEWFAFNTHVIHDGNIWFLTKKGRGKAPKPGLCCLDAETGKRKAFDGQYAFGNLLGVGSRMIMLSEKGELIWGTLSGAAFKETFRQKILTGLCWPKPVLLGNRLYARDAQGTVVCLELK